MTELIEQDPTEALLEQYLQGDYFEPGRFYDGMPNAVYHAGPGVSSTNLKRTLRSPLHEFTESQHPKPSTAAMNLGNAFHTLVLEEAEFDKRYSKSPFKDFRSAKAKEWRENEMLEGRTPLASSTSGDIWSPGEWDQVHHMRDAVMSHPTARCFFQTFIAERSLYWREPVELRLIDEEGRVQGESGRWELSKARFDAMCMMHGVGVDLKSCQDASYSGFSRSVIDFGYHISRNWYLRGAKSTKFDIEEMIFVAAEKAPPYAVGCYTIDKDMIHQADMLIKSALERYSRAVEEQSWPSYPEGVRELALPGYAKFIKIS